MTHETDVGRAGAENFALRLHLEPSQRYDAAGGGLSPVTATHELALVHDTALKPISWLANCSLIFHELPFQAAVSPLLSLTTTHALPDPHETPSNDCAAAAALVYGKL